MFLLVVYVGVVTNAGIVTFTLTQFDVYPLWVKLWIFIVFQWTCFLWQALLMYLIQETPDKVRYQRKRNKFIVSKVISRRPDENISVSYWDVHDKENPTENLEIHSSRSSSDRKKMTVIYEGEDEHSDEDDEGGDSSDPLYNDTRISIDEVNASSRMFR